ncbi:hypothetical protein [Nonlabens antarcticus]|uniref:hypothetical protein n=1 Tax=Nonlabens antarcticus TaxID=392714 RepID=UPI0018917624|nr:hypothetical protein [Nonlabens antarcticus]
MSTQELREQLQKKINVVEDAAILRQALAILNTESKNQSYIPISKHIDTVLHEDDSLLRRLAE